jgi:hypothetical protein
MTLLDEARIAALAREACQRSEYELDTAAAAIRTAVREAGEAAAKVCVLAPPLYGRGWGKLAECPVRWQVRFLRW